ncbi:TPA: phage portal protein [Klebsiella pneumoniae]|uniref:phage portal protein n=1 Tax=Klebsiella quasipneumoniae TaxID=1463165 RepID=UPI0002C411E9|nr:phage portal protein [Klebsiella quasipneumoniae]EIX9353577.1 phage portal protein [Klebsiella pneumoniae]AMR17047.1 phage portal protein [Klebsiella quasipneumoniae]AVF90431.1 phage portal protein [Klebsiella quasipneumoniae]AWO62828.1 phage portal protein [Klebsiella quasipneumoniae subsp. similipneumoniae]EMR16017.1 phage portal protein, HK97 family protein [Klebsiella quasipneumoniae]
MAKNKQQPGRVKSALLNWLGVPISLTTGEFWREWYGTSSSGKVVTADKVIRLSAVWACVRLLSESISTLPLKIYERQADGSRKLAQNNPAYQILCRRPNPEMTPSRFMLMIVASVCLRGNAFVEKLYIGSKLVSLVPLLPQNMVVKRLDSGKLQYTYADNGVQRIIPVERMMHIRGFGLDGVCGMMPTMAGVDVFGAAMAVDEAAAKIFENGLQSTGFLSSKTALNEGQRERLRKALQNFIGSKNAGKLMVLENELTYQNVTMNPEAAQLLESRSFSIEEICRWFRVPPFMVGHTTKQSSWASSLEGMNMLFLTHTLRPLLVNIEQEISRCLLNSDEDLFAEFSVEGLLRADSAGRAAYYTSALQNGWMSRNDVRRLENMPPIEGGDIYTVQLNLTQLKNLENSNPAVQALAVRELHNHVFPDIPFEQSPLKQAA